MCRWPVNRAFSTLTPWATLVDLPHRPFLPELMHLPKQLHYSLFPKHKSYAQEITQTRTLVPFPTTSPSLSQLLKIPPRSLLPHHRHHLLWRQPKRLLRLLLLILILWKEQNFHRRTFLHGVHKQVSIAIDSPHKITFHTPPVPRFLNDIQSPISLIGRASEAAVLWGVSLLHYRNFSRYSVPLHSAPLVKKRYRRKIDRKKVWELHSLVHSALYSCWKPNMKLSYTTEKHWRDFNDMMAASVSKMEKNKKKVWAPYGITKRKLKSFKKILAIHIFQPDWAREAAKGATDFGTDKDMEEDWSLGWFWEKEAG